MSLYRFYRLGRDHHILDCEESPLATDRDAVAKSMEMAGSAAIEVWQNNRKIAYIAETTWPFRNDIEQMRKAGELPRREP